VELSRYHDLFFSEAATYLQQLNRHLLELEEDTPQALEGAFRAAHTLKGMAATVGFAQVASRAHALEDRLAELRDDHGAVPADTVDTLLEGVDGLEQAVAAAQGSAAPIPEEPAGEVVVAVGEQTTWTAPKGTQAVVHVALRPDAPLRGVRATMVLRNVRELADVLGHAPAELGEDLPGDLVLFLKSEPPPSLEAAIRAAGEVETVVVEQADAAAESPAERGVASARFVRVERRHVTALADAVGELTALHGELERAFRAGAGAGDALDRMRRLLAELQTTALAVRLVPVGEVFDRFPRLVRDAARKVGKSVDLRVEGREIELDRTILEGLAEPLVHLLRNAVDHGLESPEDRKAADKPARGRLWLRARRDRGGVLISVADDGRGVDVAAVRRRAVKAGLATEDEAEAWTPADLLAVLSRPGFSAAARVSELSGRGVGLDVVAGRVRSVGGGLVMETEMGVGTTFEMRLPVTLALADAVWVAVGDEQYAIPLTHVTEVRELERRRRSIRFRGETYPAADLGELLGVGAGGTAGAAVLVDVAGRRSALLVDALLGHERIVVKEFDVPRDAHPLVSAATLRADGRPALVLDPAAA
jgi:two-component system, chemotaxis family, sensor kinase CheA